MIWFRWQFKVADHEGDDDVNTIHYEDEQYSSSDDEEINANGPVKSNRGITRLAKFRVLHGRPGQVKHKVTFDGFNRVAGLNRALFSTFLGDVVRDQIGLTVLSWKKVNKESRQKLWAEITRYFDVDVTLKKMIMNRLGQLLRNYRMKLREKYILPNLDTPSKLNERPVKYSTIISQEHWAEFVTYTTTEAFKEKSKKAKLSRSKNIYQHKMGRGGYVYVKEKMIEKKEIQADEEPPRSVLWIKGRQDKNGESPDDEISSLADKLKEADEKINEGTLDVDGGTDAMTVVFGKEKGGYARGVGSGVTYNQYFDLPRRRKENDERLQLLQTQLDTERRERQKKDLLVKQLSNEMSEKDVLVKKLSNEMAETKGVLAGLMSALKSQGVQLNMPSPLPLDSEVTTPVAIDIGANEVADGTQSIDDVRDKDAIIQRPETLKSIGTERVKNDKKTPKSRQNRSADSQSQGDASPTKELPKEPVLNAGPKKTAKSRRNGSPASLSQDNVSPTTQELPKTTKCKLWHVKKTNIVAWGTIYETQRKQMLHNQPLPDDCYRVSVDKSILDAACVPDVGNNRFHTVKSVEGSFCAWPKDQVILDEEVTPPTTKPKVSENNPGPKVQPKRKRYISTANVQAQAKGAKTQKSLTFGS